MLIHQQTYFPITLPLVRISLFFFSIFFSHLSFSQDRCGTIAHTQLLRDKNFLRETEDGFEQWMQQKLRSANQPLQTQSTQTGPYQVPVVVHVIHNGEAIGTGVNISDAQILSQIDVLNADFKRLNADAIETPEEFLPVAGALDIEFVMAKRTPEGLPSNGITRIQGSKLLWTMSDNYELKAQNYWPAEDYLNIWVTNLGGGLIGYAQFPVSPLPGLENSSNNRLTDGVAIHYRAFGTIDAGPFNLDSRYNTGRTTTHEIGHFLGLRHIWGDTNSCTSTDYVDDTPVQVGSSIGCPSHPKASCNSNDMFQNFLDYTNDYCMNLFTKGQVERMGVIIENSPRRESLLTSSGLQLPAPLPNDLALTQIIEPNASLCSMISTPKIEIANYGSNLVTAARISIKTNEVSLETIDVVVNLAPQESTIVSFSDQNLGSGNFIFSAVIDLTNGVIDGDLSNNQMSESVSLQAFITLPFSEAFNTLPSNWEVTNPDQSITWVNTSAPKDIPGNRAMMMNFFDYENSGEIDIITGPVFDLSTESYARITFDVAHARFKNYLSNDELRVVVLTNCSSDYLAGDVVYSKSGAALQTVEPMNSPFTPSAENEWRKEVIDLSSYLGQNHVQLAFITLNDYGNNLFLDNISVITEEINDVGILRLITPQPVTCNTSISPILEIQNMGSTVINNFKVRYDVDGTSPVTVFFPNLNLRAGNKMELSIPDLSLTKGSHRLTFEILEPNGVADGNPVNNKSEYNIIIDNETDRIPLRQNFDSGIKDWSIVNPTAGALWKAENTNYNISMSFQAYENQKLGDQSWLVSPILDFSTTTQASIFFDKAYAFRANTNDRLQILASKNCGGEYDIQLFDSSGEDLKTVDDDNSWTPSIVTDWTTQYLNLSSLAGEKNIRLAFIFTNDNGNNLFIDNIEFYISDDPTPPETSKPYVVYMTKDGAFGDFNITFNLENKQDVQLEVVSMQGMRVYSQLLSDVLNQTFSIDLTDGATGIYIIRLHLNGAYFASKVYVTK